MPSTAAPPAQGSIVAPGDSRARTHPVPVVHSGRNHRPLPLIVARRVGHVCATRSASPIPARRPRARAGDAARGAGRGAGRARLARADRRRGGHRQDRAGRGAAGRGDGARRAGAGGALLRPDRDAALRPLGRGARPRPARRPARAAAPRRRRGAAARRRSLPRCATTSPRSRRNSRSVLLLEDLHWADPASLDLLRVVGRHLADCPCSSLATYRDDESPRPPARRALPALVREARAARLDLRPLTPAAVRALVARALPPARRRRGAAGRLPQPRRGQPLFLGELLRRWRRRARSAPASRTAGRWATSAGARVPPLLRQVIGARVARLGEEARAAAGGGGGDRSGGAAGPVGGGERGGRGGAGRGGRAGGRGARAGRDARRPGRALRPRARPRGTLRGRLRCPGAEACTGARPRHCWRLPTPTPTRWPGTSAGGRPARGRVADRGRAPRASRLRLPDGGGALRGRAGARARRWERLGGARLAAPCASARARYYDDPRGAIGSLEEALRLATAAGDRALVAYARFGAGLPPAGIADYRRGLPELVAGATELESLTPSERAPAMRTEGPDDHYLGTFGLPPGAGRALRRRPALGRHRRRAGRIGATAASRWRRSMRPPGWNRRIPRGRGAAARPRSGARVTG